MSKPRLLDLFCCAGGAGMGYIRAGFEVVGVDKVDRPNYCGHMFVQADAIEFVLEHGHKFDAIHASPPCQSQTALTKGTNKGREYPNLIPQTREALDLIGKPYAIENVQGSEVRRDLTLCGEMFSLGVIRHRYFELGYWSMAQPAHVKHRGKVRGWNHGVYHDGPYIAAYGKGGGKGNVAEMQQAMGITWTDIHEELTEAIPPAYTQHIGEQLIREVLDARQENLRAS